MWWSRHGRRPEQLAHQDGCRCRAARRTSSSRRGTTSRQGYDYGYVEVKDPATGLWKSLPGNLTSPAGTGFGITGVSGTKWAAADYDLTAYAGKTVDLRFRYFTDGGRRSEGLGDR